MDRAKRKLFYTNGDLDPVQVLLGLILLVMVTTFVVIIYLVFFIHDPPVTVNSSRPVDNLAVSGGAITFEVDWCKHADLMVEEVRNQWIGQLIQIGAPIPAPERPSGCYVDIFRIEVPDTLPADMYDIQVTLVYQSVVAKRLVSFEVGPFMIVDSRL